MEVRYRLKNLADIPGTHGYPAKSGDEKKANPASEIAGLTRSYGIST